MEKIDIDIVTLDRMERQKILWPTYRVEIQKKISDNKANQGYRYYSNTYGHHIYFLSKRIISYVEKYFDIPYHEQLNKIDRIIKYLKQESNLDTNIVLHHLFLLSEMRNIITQNACTNNLGNHKDKALEVCDTNKFGGGFGVVSKWALLLNYLTVCEEEIPLSNKDLIVFFESLKKRVNYQKIFIAQNQSAKETIREAIKIKQPTIYVTDNFSDKEIENKIASLINELNNDKLLNPNSEFTQNLEHNVDFIQQNYKRVKSLILQQKEYNYE